MSFVSNLFSVSATVATDENNELFLTNKLVDVILNCAKQYHLNLYDPFILREKRVINFNKYVSLILNNAVIKGLTNFAKVSNNSKISLYSDSGFKIGADIQVTNIEIEANFDAKLGVPHYRYHPTHKTARVTLDRCLFYVEIHVNLRKKFIKSNNIRLVSHSKVKCTTTGFVWPVNKTVNTLIRKNIEQFTHDNQNVLENMLKAVINEISLPFYSELKNNSDFKTIVKRLNF